MTLAEMLTPHYTVVYIRPGGQYKDVDAGYGADGSEASQGSSGCLLPMGLRGAALLGPWRRYWSSKGRSLLAKMWSKEVVHMEMALKPSLCTCRGTTCQTWTTMHSSRKPIQSL